MSLVIAYGEFPDIRHIPWTISCSVVPHISLRLECSVGSKNIILAFRIISAIGIGHVLRDLKSLVMPNVRGWSRPMASYRFSSDPFHRILTLPFIYPPKNALSRSWNAFIGRSTPIFVLATACWTLSIAAWAELEGCLRWSSNSRVAWAMGTRWYGKWRKCLLLYSCRWRRSYNSWSVQLGYGVPVSAERSSRAASKLALSGPYICFRLASADIVTKVLCGRSVKYQTAMASKSLVLKHSKLQDAYLIRLGGLSRWSIWQGWFQEVLPICTMGHYSYIAQEGIHRP